jgi:hypothetical protein
VSFLQDTASELLYPLLPIYLTTVLGAPPAVVGAIEGAAEGAASMTKIHTCVLLPHCTLQNVCNPSALRRHAIHRLSDHSGRMSPALTCC